MTQIAHDRFSHRHRFDGKAPIPTRQGLVDDDIGRTVDFESLRMRHVLHEHKLEITLVPEHLKRPQDERRSLDRRIARRVHDPRPAAAFWWMHRYRFNIHTAVGEKFPAPDIPAQLRIEIECPIRFRQDFGKKFPTLVILLRDARGKQPAGAAPAWGECKLCRFSGDPDIAALQGEEHRLP